MQNRQAFRRRLSDCRSFLNLCVLSSLLLPFLLFATTGCGSRLEYGQVIGTVTTNEQPLANVLVTFVPEGDRSQKLPRSMGTTDAKGRFEMRAENSQGGVVVGKHKVIVEDLAIYDAPRSEDGTLLEQPPVRFPANYSDPLRSPLSREVRVGEQTIELELSFNP